MKRIFLTFSIFILLLSPIISNAKQLIISTAVSVTASTEITSGISTQFESIGSLNISAGQTLTISGPITIVNKVFTGSGNIIFGNVVDLPTIQIWESDTVTLASGQHVIYPQWWGNDSAAVFSAISAATTASAKLIFPPGTYTITGSSAMNIDLGKMSIEGYGAILDCSAMTSTYAMNVFSSETTFPNNSINNTHYIRGIGLLGGYDVGRHGMLIGHATYERQDQIEIGDCFIQYFDRNISFTSNSWRPVFRRMTILNPVNYNIYMPTGLTNSGEVIAFSNCEIVGGTVLIGDTYQFRFDQCSLLSSSVSVGASNSVYFSSGNIENVGVAEYKFIDITGANSLVKVNDTSINPFDNLTDSIFNVAANSKLIFDGIIWPGVASTHLMETTTGYKAFCKGDGLCTAINSGYRPGGGDGESVISKTSNEVHNGDFELGDTTGWTITPFGDPNTGTATADAAALKNDSFGLLIDVPAGGAGTGGVNITQTKKCNPGQMVVVGGWGRVIVAGTGGYLTIYFLNVDGDTISSVSEAYNSLNWTWVGTTCTAYAPPGTDSVMVEINYAGSPCTIHWDELIMNII